MTQVTSNLWIYFLKIENNDDRVMCKLCRKSLNANRNFNLKQHLKQSHKLQIQTEKKQKRVKPAKQTGIRKDKRSQQLASLKNRSYLSVESGDNFCEINKEALESNYSVGKDSLDPTNIKPAGILDVVNDASNDVIDTLGNETTFEIVRNYETENFGNNIETLTTNPSNEPLPPGTKPDSLEVFSINPNKTARNFNDPLNETDHLRRDDIKLHCKKKKSSLAADDPLDESTSSCKDDRFDQWAHKKQKLMDLEYIEMRNYKLKLELWEKEQQLHLASSKYTRDIRSNL